MFSKLFVTLAALIAFVVPAGAAYNPGSGGCSGLMVAGVRCLPSAQVANYRHLFCSSGGTDQYARCRSATAGGSAYQVTSGKTLRVYGLRSQTTNSAYTMAYGDNDLGSNSSSTVPTNAVYAFDTVENGAEFAYTFSSDPNAIQPFYFAVPSQKYLYSYSYSRTASYVEVFAVEE